MNAVGIDWQRVEKDADAATFGKLHYRSRSVLKGARKRDITSSSIASQGLVTRAKKQRLPEICRYFRASELSTENNHRQ